MINCDNEETERQVKETVQTQVKKQMIKSKTVSQKGIEVRLKEMSTDFINRIASMPGVGNAVLVSYNGDYMA